MLLLALLACPSPSPTDTGCRDDADCADGRSCWAPDACNVGDYEDPPDECVPGEPCGDGWVCALVPETCGVGPHQVCVEPCPARACADDERCDEVTGLCGAWMCTDGYSCPPYTHCDPSGDARSGCVRDVCADDADCAGGFCVDGTCHATPGTCDYAHP